MQNGKSKFKKNFMLIFLLTFVILAVVIIFLQKRCGSKDIRNVVLISIDTCRADYLSCYGCPKETTPNIDKLSQNGVLFKNVITPTPITLPSHSSMFTGTLPLQHGVHDNYDYKLGESNVCIAEILKDNGFATGAVISALVMESRFGLAQGFDNYHESFENMLSNNDIEQRSGAETTRFALEWLDGHKDGNFFFFLHYFDPHAEYNPPEPFASKFSDNPYAGEVAFVDYCIGQVIDKLKELDLYDSTLIIVTADHGEMLGEHNELTHSYYIYQSAIKVPLIFKLPGLNKGKKIDTTIGLIDIVPTICGLLGIEAPKEVQGVDLSGCLRGNSLPQKGRGFYCESLTPTKYNANSLLGVVQDEFKYIQTSRPELYNLTEDPQEVNNLLEVEPQRAKVLKDKLVEMIKANDKNSRDSQLDMSDDDRRRIESLGYVGGKVIEDYNFEQDKPDPKDVIDFHNLNSQCVGLIVVGELEKAEETANEIIAQDPGYAKGYAHLARIYQKQGDFDAAMEYYQKALAINPDMAEENNNLGLIFQRKGMLDEAISCFRKTLETYPDKAVTLVNLGNALQLVGDADWAVAAYMQALESDPDNADAHYNFGNLLVEQNKVEEASAHYRMALRIDPSLAEAHCNLANILNSQSNVDEAAAHYLSALEIAPNLSQAHYNLGVINGAQGNIDAAVGHYNKSILSDPNYANSYNNLGNIFLNRGELDKAVAHYEKALAIDPDIAEAHHNIGSALSRMGKIDESFEHYRHAVGLKQDLGSFYFQVCQAFAKKGDVDMAIRFLELVIEANPDSYELHYRMSMLLAEKGDFDEAIKSAEKALQYATAAGDDSFVEAIGKSLELYKHGKTSD